MTFMEIIEMINIVLFLLLLRVGSLWLKAYLKGRLSVR